MSIKLAPTIALDDLSSIFIVAAPNGGEKHREYSILNVDSKTFACWLQTVIEGSDNQQKAEKIINSLDLSISIDRWWAINELADIGIDLNQHWYKNPSKASLVATIKSMRGGK
ncbi:hypothetical protein [Tengunoibacter tsumagoiensis]|uniref:Uncharacterized protein n=1 Tax=Tengunoibacter tsumagoiensis TaxID=2014871 RepID=A0A402A5D3_9CHLR|nr:hypothetical protein [Tengunoibacter tsumagoiensis]GCE14171.1 hypothetical protein KTT_40300 [Tengunoibacter tsumagoiensis]GCE14225.1 hypothetical protein KTT_40840 [Tengunoibacter tsumagoiensis]